MGSLVTGLATSFCYFFIFLTSFTFPILSDSRFLNYFGTFYLFAFLALLGIFFVGLAVPSQTNAEFDLNAAIQNQG